MAELNETQRYFIDEHIEDYMDGLISRRELLRRVTLISGSAVLAGSIVAACGTPAPTAASPTATVAASAATRPPSSRRPSPRRRRHRRPAGVTVQENDPRITVSKPEIKGTDGALLMAYMAKPNSQRHACPGVVIIHENRGQTEHIRDVVRRAATAGFVAVNIDLAARDGGADKLTDSAAYNAALAKRDLAAKLSDHNATIAFLKAQSSGAIGVTGFCFGGGETWNIVTALNPT